MMLGLLVALIIAFFVGASDEEKPTDQRYEPTHEKPIEPKE